MGLAALLLLDMHPRMRMVIAYLKGWSLPLMEPSVRTSLLREDDLLIIFSFFSIPSVIIL
jgi:hypothetical protein